MYKRFFRYFWRYLDGYKIKVLITLLTLVTVIVIGNFISPIIIAQFFNHIQAGDLTFEISTQLIIYYAFSQLSTTVFGWRLLSWMRWRIGLGLEKKVFNDLFDRMSAKSTNFYSDNFSGSITSNFNKFVGAIDAVIEMLFWNIVPLTVTIVSTVVILWFYFWQYALLLAILVIIYLAIIIYTTKVIADKSKAVSKATSKRTGLLSDAISNITLVKSYGREKTEKKSLSSQSETVKQKGLIQMRQHLVNSLFYSSTTTAFAILAFALAAIATQNNWIAVGTVYIMLSYSVNLNGHLWNSSNVFRRLNQTVGRADPMIDLLESEDIIHDKSSKKIRVSAGAIEFSKVLE